MASTSDWSRVIWTAVGGLLAVAIPDERRVIAGSVSGIGVFDSLTGKKIHRVIDHDWSWYDEQALTIRFPGSSGSIEEYSSMGIEGGTLPTTTLDGWSCQVTDRGAVLTRGNDSVEIADAEELRAYGFSPRGSLFVYATSPNLTVLRRSTLSD